MKAKSIKGKSPEELQSALLASTNAGFKPTLAIVFISVKQDRKAVCELLQKADIDVFGATSSGEFINDYQDEKSIVALLLEINPDHYTLFFEPIRDRTIPEAAGRIAENALEAFEKPSLILCSTGLATEGGWFDGATLVNSLKSALGENVAFFGGMAGDDMALIDTFIFTGTAEANYGIAALAFDAAHVELQGMAITGSQTVGLPKTITKSRGKVVYSIDGKPAPEVYLRYLGKQGMEASDGFDLMHDVSLDYPLLLERDVGEPIPRLPLRIDQTENALVFDMEMQEGARVWFAIPPDLNIAETIVSKANELKAASMPDADAMLIFSCAGRLSTLGPLITNENEGLADLWKVPMAGFFTYGEFGKYPGRPSEFHSGACSWVAIKEK